MFYRSANLVVTASVMGCLAIVAVALRFWCKGIRRTKIGADDILIIVGLVRLLCSSIAISADHWKLLALGLCVCNIIGAVQYRFGNHEIFIQGGPLDGWPVAWLLLGYGKVSNNLQSLLFRCDAGRMRTLIWFLDLLRYSTVALHSHASHQSILDAFLASDFWPCQSVPPCSVDYRHLRFSLVVHHILDEHIPMLAYHFKLGYNTSTDGKLYP